jgi:hypothetical protein
MDAWSVRAAVVAALMTEVREKSCPALEVLSDQLKTPYVIFRKSARKRAKQLCDICHQPTRKKCRSSRATKKCKGRFCSKDCLRSAWPFHKYICTMNTHSQDAIDKVKEAFYNSKEALDKAEDALRREKLSREELLQELWRGTCGCSSKRQK